MGTSTKPEARGTLSLRATECPPMARIRLRPASYVVFCLCALLNGAVDVSGYTARDEVDKLCHLRSVLYGRGGNWPRALRDWDCCNDRDNCDPCGNHGSVGPTGKWRNIHCRNGNGRLTGIHLTAADTGGLHGQLPKELCMFPEITEIDFDNQNLHGQLPNWLGTCFPKLRELDLQNNGGLWGCVPSGVGKSVDVRIWGTGAKRCKDSQNVK